MVRIVDNESTVHRIPATVQLDGTARRGMQANPVSGVMHQTPHLLTEALRGGGAPGAAGSAAKAVLASATPSAGR